MRPWLIAGMVAAAVLGMVLAHVAVAIGQPLLRICWENSAGQCTGTGGWFTEGDGGDTCSGQLMSSSVPGTPDAVWVDDGVPDPAGSPLGTGRQTMIDCELARGVPGYHLFVGIFNSAPEMALRFTGAQTLAEYYPWHLGYGQSITQAYGCPPNLGLAGFITQHGFAWPNDTPPTADQAAQEWARAIGCITTGTRPMGSY